MKSFSQNGQTALDIAQKLGYISVIETLKVVTETVITTTHTVTIEEKYRVQAPESMQETFMSDSEDEGGKYSCKRRLSPWLLFITYLLRYLFILMRKLAILEREINCTILEYRLYCCLLPISQ